MTVESFTSQTANLYGFDFEGAYFFRYSEISQSGVLHQVLITGQMMQHIINEQQQLN